MGTIDISDIKNGWRGSKMISLHEGKTEESKEYIRYMSNVLFNPIMSDPKRRLHYYTKSFLIPYYLNKSGIDTSYHIGIASTRYITAYQFFNIEPIGCDLNNINSNGSDFRDYNFLTTEDKTILSHLENIDIESTCVVSEASFYYLVDDRFKDIDAAKEGVDYLRQRLKERIKLLRSIGIKNFLFIEPEHKVIDTLITDIKKTKVDLREEYKYDFLLDYTDLLFPKIVLYSDNQKLIDNLKLFT